MQKILLLHGALGSVQSFITLEKSLSADFQVYTFNFEGHGGREMPPHPFRIERFAKEVLAFLAENQIEQISVFGYSMGGYVGLYLAKHYPEKVCKLFTLATKLNWTLEGARKEVLMLNPSIIKEKVPKYAAMLLQQHGENWEILLQKTAEMMLYLGENPTLKPSDFEQISTPTCIAVGDKDVMVSQTESLGVYHLLRNGQFQLLPDTFHPLEKVNIADLASRIAQYMQT